MHVKETMLMYGILHIETIILVKLFHFFFTVISYYCLTTLCLKLAFKFLDFYGF